MKIFFVIPAFNEETQIGTVIGNIAKIMQELVLDYRVLIVDDGSEDKTYEIALSYKDSVPLEILRHYENKGVAEAFRTGFNRALELGSSGDSILTMEANKNSDPSLIPLMIRKLANGSDLVLASCYAPGGKVVNDPLFRLFLSKGINKILRVIFPIKVHTFTSFYRLWKHDLVEQLKEQTNGRYFDQEGFACMADALIKASRMNNIRISEVPLVLYSDIKGAGSKMKIFKTIRGYLILIFSNLKLR